MPHGSSDLIKHSWREADPMCTCLFGVIVLNTTRKTLVRTTETLMGKAPEKIDQSLGASKAQAKGP